MDDFEKNKQIVKQREAKKALEYKEESKKRLLKISSSKVRTTMIGAVDTIEKRLKEFKLLPEDGEKPSNEQLLIKKLYDSIRKDILDKGNNQIRNLEEEFEQYEIEWKRYTLIIPVKKLGEKG